MPASISLCTSDFILFIFSVLAHCLPSFAFMRQVTILIVAIISPVAFNYSSSLVPFAYNPSTLYMNYAFLSKANNKYLVSMRYYSTSPIIPKSS